jgi:hypothetical protein
VVLFRRDELLAAAGWSPDLALWGVEDWECYLRVARTAPIACHGRTVAEYRMHEGQISGDSRRMLASTVTLLTREAAHTAGHPRRERARRAGLRYWRVRGGYTTAVEAGARAKAAGDGRAGRRALLRAACWYAPSLAYWLPESLPARWIAARVLRRDLRP